AFTGLAALTLAGTYGQYHYVEAGRDRSGSAAEVPDASRSAINKQFQQVLASDPEKGPVVLDTINVVVAKFQAFYTQGLAVNFPSRDFFSYYAGGCNEPGSGQLSAPSSSGPFGEAVCSGVGARQFTFPDGVQDTFWTTTFGVPTPPTCETLIMESGDQSIFNRRQLTIGQGQDFVERTCSQ